MNKILITGISGFVGSHLVNSLSSRFTIYGLDIITNPIPGVDNIYTWNSLNSIPSVDIIIHLAGKAHDLKNTSQEQDYFDVNTGLTKIIFDYFIESETNMFFFMSSVKAVKDRVIGILSEETSSDPITSYGRSKKAAEDYILSKPLSKEKYYYILRPCMIHGPNNKGNLNLLYNMISKGIPYPLGAFDNNRSFLSIENLSFIVNRMIETRIPSGIYQLSDDNPVSTNKLIDIIATSLGSNKRILKINPNIIRIIAKLGDLLHLPLTNERLQKLTESYVVSNEKIKRYLNISEMPISSEEGLRQTMNSFKLNN